MPTKVMTKLARVSRKDDPPRRLIGMSDVAFILGEHVCTTFRRIKSDPKFAALFRKIGAKNCCWEDELYAFAENLPSLSEKA